ncbi:MAG: DUF3325 domain-containing protein [Pseudomonadota bacterium]
MNHWPVLLLCVVGFACLALAMERHQEDLWDEPLAPAVTRVLRRAGWTLLAASLAFALVQPQSAVGLVAWFGWLSAAAGIVFVGLLLAQRVRKGRRA